MTKIEFGVVCGLGIREKGRVRSAGPAASQQLVNHYLPIQATDLVNGEALELTLLPFRNFDDHAFKCALGATVDVDHLTSDRCRKVHPGGFLITEENLSFRYKIPFTSIVGFHAGVVRP